MWNELGCWFLEDLNQDQMVVVLNQEMVSQGKQREGMGADCLNLKADSAWMFKLFTKYVFKVLLGN